MKSQNRRTPRSEDVQEIETAWIPMSDGNRLAARIWLPACAKERRVAAVMEYIPYRRRDLSRSRDEPMHRYFAEHGYASLRVDLRGSGDSDGLLEDEYTRQEWDDGVEAIAWIAAQRWCNGPVGMIGLSWGGFTALQIAALRPPALKAIVTVGSTDDRYRDDMHFTGGCLIDDQTRQDQASKGGRGRRCRALHEECAAKGATGVRKSRGRPSTLRVGFRS